MRLFEFDYSAMVRKLRSVYALVQRGATEGERSAAERVFKQTLSAIVRDFGEEKAAQAERQAKGSYGKQERPKARAHRAYREPPKREKPRQKQKSTDSFYTYNGWKFSILRFTDPSAGKRGSDKVWGFAVKDSRYMTFWGAFGKTIQTKEVGYNEANKKFLQKAAKGYRPVDANPIDYGYIFSQSDTW